jgi:hypothetical protein
MDNLKIRLKGDATGDFGYSFILLKGNAPTISNTTDNPYSFKADPSIGPWQKLILVVSGRTKGGNYTLEIVPPGFSYKVTYECKINYTTDWVQPYWPELDGPPSYIYHTLTKTGLYAGNIPKYYLDKYMGGGVAEVTGPITTFKIKYIDATAMAAG